MKVEKMKKSSIEAVWSIFEEAKNCTFLILQCKNGPLHIISKSNPGDWVWALNLFFLANLDIITYACVAFFCANAYFYRNVAKKNYKISPNFTKSAFFTLHPYNPHFLDSDRLRSIESCLLHIQAKLWISLDICYEFIWIFCRPFHGSNFQNSHLFGFSPLCVF